MSFESMMEELRKEYISELSIKIIELDAYSKIEDSAGVKGLLHKLKGTGRTYGIPEISTLAEAGEQLIQAYPERLHKIVRGLTEILGRVQSARQQAQAFHLESDPTFLEFKKFSN